MAATISPAHPRSTMDERAELLVQPVAEILALDPRFASLPPDEQVRDAVNQQTDFFRDRQALRIVKEIALPSFGAQPSITLASVGCSDGKEVYSLLLDNWDRREVLNFHGYEVNRDRLSEARAGRYSLWHSFDSNYELLQELAEVHPEIGLTIEAEANPNYQSVAFGADVMRRVEFAELDIVTQPLPRPFDIVILANVLMHYNSAGRSLILENIAKGLNPGGWLICERSPWMDPSPERMQYREWMKDLSAFGLEKQRVVLPGYLLEDQTDFSQAYRLSANRPSETARPA